MDKKDTNEEEKNINQNLIREIPSEEQIERRIKELDDELPHIKLTADDKDALREIMKSGNDPKTISKKISEYIKGMGSDGRKITH